MSDDQSGVVTLKVRVTPEFREKIVDTAKQNNRSMNQEIVSRLEQSFTTDSNSPSQAMLQYKDEMDKQTQILMEQYKFLVEQNKRQEEILRNLKEFQEWKESKEKPATKTNDDWT